MLRHMRTSIDISDALLTRARRVAQKRKVALKQLVEEGLRKVLAEALSAERFELADARFRGEAGFAKGAGPDSIGRAIAEINDPRRSDS